jgi:hypothetical protein
MLFSALYGTGCQIATLITGVILFAIAGPLHGDVYEKRGEMVRIFNTIFTRYLVQTSVLFCYRCLCMHALIELACQPGDLCV